MSFPIRASLHHIFPMQFSDIESILQPYFSPHPFHWFPKCHYHIFFYYQSFCFAHQWLLYCFWVANAPSAFFQPKQYMFLELTLIDVRTNECNEWARSFEPYGEIRTKLTTIVFKTNPWFLFIFEARVALRIFVTKNHLLIVISCLKIHTPVHCRIHYVTNQTYGTRWVHEWQNLRPLRHVLLPKKW